MRRLSKNNQGWIYTARARDCRNCSLRKRCVPSGSRVRKVLTVFGYEALLRGRRRRAMRDAENSRARVRHKWRVEGRHAEAKEQHGLRRAVRRGLEQVAIQVYLTAAAMNL